MDPVHREVLEDNHSHLVTSLRARDITDQLLKDEVINKYDYDQLKRTEAQGSRAVNRLLLLTLRRRGCDAYPALHRALRDSGQDDLCDVMLDCELNLREGLATERMERALAACQHYPGLNGLSLAAETDVHLRTADTLSTSPPILRKATSPALRSSTTPREVQPSPGRVSSQPSPQPIKGASSPTPSSKQQNAETERQIEQLEREVLDLRQSHSKMETELKQQIEQLEKDQAAAGKKGGGCVVM